jgi:hypothetical protein
MTDKQKEIAREYGFSGIFATFDTLEEAIDRAMDIAEHASRPADAMTVIGLLVNGYAKEIAKIKTENETEN